MGYLDVEFGGSNGTWGIWMLNLLAVMVHGVFGF
jgi:hypothetical protein